MSAVERSDAYLIVKRGLYYKPHSQGYIGIRDLAGRFPLAEVATLFPNTDSPNQDGMTFVHEDDAPEFSEACWDDVKASWLMQQRDEARAELEALRRPHPAPAMEAEPVAWLIEGYGVTEIKDYSRIYGKQTGKTVRPLYAHPQDAESLRGEVDHFKNSWKVQLGRANDLEAERDAALARVAELESKVRIAQNAQIARGDVFSDTNPESRYIEDIENSCPACGGSGHKDDAALTPQPDAGLEALLRNAQALLDIDASGAMVPHGIGGLARGIITDLITALRSRPVGEVKQLVWIKEEASFIWRAGAYQIRDDGDGYDVDFCGQNLAFIGHNSCPLPLGEAERTAQEHHEAYIRAALSPASLPQNNGEG